MLDRTYHSKRSKKAWRSRKRRARALASLRETLATKPAKSPVGYAAIIAATTDDKSSTDVARELGLTAAYVRKAWARCGLPKRQAGAHWRGERQ